MMLKHKKSGLVLEVTPGGFASLFYEASIGCMIRRDDNRWEVVKEDEREDVTSHYQHALDRASGAALIDSDTFKFIDGMHNGPAFVIERKKG